MKVVPQKYLTVDGEEFETEADARRHENLVTAYESYEQALDLLGRCLMLTQKSADGEPFQINRYGDYYRVVSGWAGEPRLETVPYIGHDFTWSAEEDAVYIKTTVNGQPVSYRVSELYQSERAAQLALHEQQGEWISGMQADQLELGKKLGFEEEGA